MARPKKSKTAKVTKPKKVATAKKRGPGQPSKFNDYKKLIIKMAARGFTDKEMAEVVGVTITTIANWKKNNPSFFDTLKIQKKMADDGVERSLFERATGYSCPETKVQWVPDGHGGGKWETLDLIKHYPPDTTAIIFWLKNRQPERWRDKHDIDHSGNVILTAPPISKPKDSGK